MQPEEISIRLSVYSQSWLMDLGGITSNAGKPGILQSFPKADWVIGGPALGLFWTKLKPKVRMSSSQPGQAYHSL